MDPLSALSIAASVAQFLDFGTKIICHTKEIADNGSSVTVKHISGLNNDLIEINSSLKRQLLAVTTQNLPLTREAQALLDLTDQCNEIAKELATCLQKITINSHKTDKWTNIKTALRTMWKQERIDELAKKLTDYRGQLTLRVLLLLNSYYATQSERLDQLAESNKEIVEVVSINLGSMSSKLEAHQRNESFRREQASADADRKHSEIITAILTTRGGDSRAITADNAPRLSTNFSTDKIVHTATTYKHGMTSYSESSAPELQTTEFNGFSRQILDALHFRSIADRRAAISPAHKKTFQWIYQDSMPSEKEADSLVRWLRSGKGCYWVNGKAGSGKSTLMKYIREDIRTMQSLRQWAGSSDLIVGSFFFWYAGTPIQKSQMGLLRSLLLEVLGRREDLIPVLFPEVCRSILTKETSGYIELSSSELKRAFSTFITSASQGLKTCFIIDGIDEYDGDHNDICDLLSQATASESVKVLLSSRPIPACVQAFSSCPTLRLQDLTYSDVKLYIEDQLGQDPLLQRLERSTKGATDHLFKSITSKAAGVLLWVILVVRSIREGLQDYDTIEDLQQRIDELPPTLESLYAHMLGSMSPRHRHQGSKLLQLVLRSSETHGEYPMTVLQLSFAEEENYAKLVKSQVGSKLSPEEEDWRCEAIEGRMRSRCRGLIEVHDSPLSFGEGKGANIVGFLHRTVVEFLQTDLVWAQLISLTAGTSFNVDLALLASCLCEMRAKPLSRTQQQTSPAIYSMLRMLSYGRNMDDITNQFHSIYLPEARNILGNYWHDPALYESAQAEMKSITAATSTRCSQLGLSYPESFLMSVASHCPRQHLVLLFDFFYPTTEELDGQNSINLLGIYLLLQYMDPDVMPLRLAISRNIVACRIEPQKSVYHPLSVRKLWNHRWRDPPMIDQRTYIRDYFLQFAYSRTQDSDLHDSILSIISSSLTSGGSAWTINVASDLHSAGSTGYLEVSAYSILYPLMNKLWHARNATTVPPIDLDNLVNKACYIERIMRSDDARMWTQLHNPLYPQSPTKPKKRSKRTHIPHQRSRTIPPTALIDTPKIIPPNPRVYSALRPEPSPWTQYRHRKEQAAELGQEVPEPIVPKTVVEGHLQKRWNITARDSRIHLLDPQEQELAEKMSRPLSGKEKLQAFKEMSRLPYQRQEQILECSKVLQQKREAEVRG
ncbi:uncharacterized protein LY89DRAFT_651612 [Mollisia scopiformis]|uniref:Uncharacterized protein n=1 Tax=Mollisia scopiformis TaxID=149040 RepID=A0A194WZP4_MOLSC|nr:uncharacterized protein LY89DRAFT_651612 [Mollisia scopiformis]KUJ13415.1 hypothetical protein LY89DRAFT_651612 [Mollisia scopiformis]